MLKESVSALPTWRSEEPVAQAAIWDGVIDCQAGAKTDVVSTGLQELIPEEPSFKGELIPVHF
jgi:hypothetical protein